MNNKRLFIVVLHWFWSKFYSHDKANSVQSYVYNYSLLEFRHQVNEYEIYFFYSLINQLIYLNLQKV